MNLLTFVILIIVKGKKKNIRKEKCYEFTRSKEYKKRI